MSGSSSALPLSKFDIEGGIQYSAVQSTDLGDNNSSPSKVQVITKEEAKIDANRARFPLCIVWTPLPGLTWLLPMIGHTGIAMSDGVIHDFQGPYTIGVDDLAFGECHK